jgi:hypothetical protein
MGVAYRVGGTWGLMVLKAFLAIIPAALAWSALKRTQFAWRWFGVALVSWGTLALAFTLRPQLWTAIALFVVCRVLTSGSKRALWSLPLLFAAWANLHGGWIVGGALLAVWTTKAWLERSSQRWHFLLVGITSLAATLLTPYGVDLWMFLAETVRLNRNDISEWSPIWRAGRDSASCGPPRSRLSRCRGADGTTDRRSALHVNVLRVRIGACQSSCAVVRNRKRRAHFSAVAQRSLAIALPREDARGP